MFNLFRKGQASTYTEDLLLLVGLFGQLLSTVLLLETLLPWPAAQPLPSPANSEGAPLLST